MGSWSYVRVAFTVKGYGIKVRLETGVKGQGFVFGIGWGEN